MATVRDLSAFLDDGALTYPGIPSKKHPAGKTYVVPSPDARTGVWLAATTDLGVAAATGATLTADDSKRLLLDDDQERTFYERVLGPVYAEMIDDGVTWALLKHVGNDAYLCFGMDEDVADVVLANLGKERAAANRETRRLVAKAAKATKGTQPSTGGLSSSRVSTGTPVRTRPRASSPSSTSPTVRKPTRKAANG